MVGIFQVGIFWVGIFRGDFPRTKFKHIKRNVFQIEFRYTECPSKKYIQLWRSISNIFFQQKPSNTLQHLNEYNFNNHHFFPLMTLPFPIPDEAKKLRGGLKDLHKTFWGTTKKRENKILTSFLFQFQKQLSEMHGTLRVKLDIFLCRAPGSNCSLY